MTALRDQITALGPPYAMAKPTGRKELVKSQTDKLLLPPIRHGGALMPPTMQ